MAEKSRGHDRTRVWLAVVYPESAPENWRSYLDDEYIEWAESPLHEFDIDDKGINPDGTFEFKKPHWHLVLNFDGPKSFDQVCEILAPLNCPIPKKAHTIRGAVRYFTHIDYPDKYQYNQQDIVAHGGFDIEVYFAPSESEKFATVKEMQKWCRDNDVTEYSHLLDYASEVRYEDWYPLLLKEYTFVMTQYLKSRRFKNAACKASDD